MWYISQSVQKDIQHVKPLLEGMSKKCKPCGAKSEKMLKTPGVRTTFGGSDVASLQYLHYITLHYLLHFNITLHSTTLQLHHTQLHSTENYTTLHYYTYTTLHYTTLTTFHYTSLHLQLQLQIQLQLQNYTPLHSELENNDLPLHFTTLH